MVGGLLRRRGLEDAADQMAIADLALQERNASRLQQARRLMRSLGAQGMPGLVVHTPTAHRLLAGNVLYGDIDPLLEQIAAC